MRCLSDNLGSRIRQRAGFFSHGASCGNEEARQDFIYYMPGKWNLSARHNTFRCLRVIEGAVQRNSILQGRPHYFSYSFVAHTKLTKINYKLDV